MIVDNVASDLQLATTCDTPGSVLGPKQFIEYSEDYVDEIFARHGLLYYQFADDMQTVNHGMASALHDCIIGVRRWCSTKRLHLNAEKTEIMWFGSTIDLNRLRTEDKRVKSDQ